jgi:hypothetical protein
MATADVTYSFTADTKAQASQVNTNFSDLVDFINTNCIQKDGSKAMTGALTLSGDPSSDTDAAPKQYVDYYVETTIHPTIASGAKFGAGPFQLSTNTITDPGYDIEVWGAGVVLIQGFVLEYGQLYWQIDGVSKGAIVIPYAATSVDQTFAAILPPTTHTAGTNCTVKLMYARHSGSHDATVSGDTDYQAVFLKWRRH